MKKAGIFLLIVLPFTIAAIFSYIKIKENLTENIHARRQSIAELSAIILKERFDRLKDISTSIATRVKFRELVEEGKWEDAATRLNDVPKSFPVIDRIILSDTMGILKGNVTEAVPSVLGKDFSHRDWYKGVSKNRTPYISEAYKRTAKPSYNVITVVTTIGSADDQTKVIGIVAFQIRLDTLLKWSKEINVGGSGFVYIIDHNGHLVANPKHLAQGDIMDYSKLPVVQKVLNGEKGIGLFDNQEGKEKQLIAYYPIKEYGWGILVQQPESAAFDERETGLKRLAWIYFFIFLLNILLAYFIIHIMTKREKAEIELRNSEAELKKLNESLEMLVQERTEALQRSYDNLEAKVTFRNLELEKAKKTNLAKIDELEKKIALLSSKK